MDARSKTANGHDITATECTGPNACFEGGDVVIRLSRKEQDTMIIPSRLLISGSDWFKTSLEWQLPRIRDGAIVPTWHYGLIYDRALSTWTLESSKKELGVTHDGRVSLPPEVRHPHLYVSIIPSRCEHLSHMDFIWDTEAQEEAIITHKYLLAVLLNQRTDLDTLEISKLAITVGNMMSLAEYYQLLESLNLKFEGLLRRHPDLDTDILANPVFYLGIGEILRSGYLYKEAMRHFVSRNAESPHTRYSSWTDGPTDNECPTLSAATVELAHTKEIELRAILADLDRYLLTRVGLKTQSRHAYPIFSNPRRKPSMSEENRFLAHAVWRDWVLQHTHGEPGRGFLLQVVRGRTRCKDWPKWCSACNERMAGWPKWLYSHRGNPVFRRECRDDFENDQDQSVAVEYGSPEAEGQLLKELDKTDIDFLGSHLTDDVLNAYHPRMGRANGNCTSAMRKAQRELKWSLHEIVRDAGDAVLSVLTNPRYPAARAVDYGWFRVTNMRFEAGEMPWEQKNDDDELPPLVSGREDEAEEEQEGEEDEGWDFSDIGKDEQEEATTAELLPASETWLKAIGFLR